MHNKYIENYKKQNIRECQLKQLQILKEFDEFCKKYDIHYWLDGGTLLGAIRHRGFIPWDDDIDLAITPQDFDKLVKHHKDLPNNLFFQTCETDNTNSQIPKIRDLNSLYIEPTYYFDEDYQKGVYIDIFPKIPYPSAPLKLMKKIQRQLWKSNMILHIKHYYSLKALLEFFYFHFIKIINSLLWKSLFLFYKTNKYIGDMPGNNVTGNSIHNIKYTFPLSKIKFENLEFPAPADPDNYLREQYGDYMIIPPPEKRMSHSIFFLPELIKDPDPNIT